MTATTESVRLLRPPLLFDRLYADATGESHFAPLSVAMTERVFAPPAPAFWVSSLAEATQQGFLFLPAGWTGERHPSPIRMWIFVLSGAMEFQASDGDSRPLPTGRALMLEDTSGKGHLSWVVGPDDVTLAVVQLPEA
ncbi:cupin domain-containing protein [Cupriavidus gilardii]|uniref:Cupin domain-containing protein n=1 Tax=Cupriavidus gilardii TaxID=82541 RepID=A0ABY4VPN5_9BURK|nr:cupin domain-containing protein [Cupriavidus gilardii]MCT9074916.1 cupin domain-containing protein [Cupriavidus gilardii]QKS63405.1 cupin domain-containing protein [Cupriavidus gilardii]QQE07801.1 cupin domain-containing protein [Cupriavidus sp. ISTL7]USE78963.1 cupin domain-containing protein [Cupriavidus gilardii]